jgi:CRISPR-associated endonuclease/helicase Cas3
MGGWDILGHIPNESKKDVGDRAAFAMRRAVCLRLHPQVMAEWPEGASRDGLAKLGQEDTGRDTLLAALNSYRAEIGAAWPAPFLDKVKAGEFVKLRVSSYPNGVGSVVDGRKKRKEDQKREGPVFLDDHSKDVEAAVDDVAPRGLDSEILQCLRTAAKFHDYGKADRRFQALLRGGDAMAAHFAPRLLAKSGYDEGDGWSKCGLPDGFRHELLSLMFAAKSVDREDESRDLLLHIIASHHGRCRPFAPVVVDNEAPCVSYNGMSVCARDRRENAPHRTHEVADRFWRLTRQYGWWGLAYLEALFRLADWLASDREDAEVSG